MRGRALAYAGHATHTMLGPRGRGVAMGATFSFQSTYMHTVGDRAEAVNQMALDATRLYTTIGTAIGALPEDGGAARVALHEAHGQPTAWYTWWAHSAQPTLTAWAKFHTAQTGGEGRDGLIGDYLSWTNRFETDWSTYTDWAKRLDSVLQGAILLGIMPKDSPKVAPLGTTAIEDVENAAKQLGHDAYQVPKDALGFVKIAAYTGLGLAGAILVTSIVQNVREGQDPVGRYVSYARGR